MNRTILFAHWSHARVVCGNRTFPRQTIPRYRMSSRVGMYEGDGCVICISTHPEHSVIRPLVRSCVSGFAGTIVGTKGLTGTRDVRLWAVTSSK